MTITKKPNPRHNVKSIPRTVSIPKHIDAAMRQLGKINWSQVAAKAFSAEVARLQKKSV